MTRLLQRYPLYFPIALSTAFGLLFPVLAIAFLLIHEKLTPTTDNIAQLHTRHFDLLIIWLAPLVLGGFGMILGRIGLLLTTKMDSLTTRTAQLNTILDTAAGGIIAIDRHGIILSFNKSAEIMFGYSLTEVVGRNISMLMPSDIAIQHDEFLKRYLNSRIPTILNRRREIQAQRKNGEIFPAQLRVNEMDLNGVLFFTGVIDDISETRALENQLNQSQKLEAIGQLAAGIAHEINTPIQYIGDNLEALQNNFNDLQALLEALRDKLTVCDPDIRQELIDLENQYDLGFILEDTPVAIRQSREGVKQVANIVKAMKGFSHMDNGMLSQIDLQNAIQNALIITKNQYKYVAVTETDFTDLPLIVEGYAGELNQVFLNLIVNAAHAIEDQKPDQGLIRIAGRKLPGYAELTVSDNGTGIPTEIRDKVFNLFFTTKEVGRGTGQGLNFAHNVIVEKHHGKFYFESSEGEGTTFFILLPFSQQSSDSTSA